MKKSTLLSDLLQTKLFLGPEGPAGFRTLKCGVCSDHSPRAGFKFESGFVIYNCFNCGAKAVYEEYSGKFNKNTRAILEAFGISRSELDDLAGGIFFNADTESREITLSDLQKPNFVTAEVALPPSTYLLGNDDHYELQIPILEYLEHRQIDPIKNGLMYSLAPKYLRRAIIPFTRDDKIIYWQARSIDDVKQRYLNCTITKEAVMYGYNQLYKWDTSPLFVTEGVFDAMQCGGVCILGSVLNRTKIELLQRSKRRLIFVIDRDENGHALGKMALANNWEITFVDVNADDIADSINKFGKIYTAYSLMKNVSRIGKAGMLESKLSLDLGVLDKKLRGSKYG